MLLRCAHTMALVLVICLQFGLGAVLGARLPLKSKNLNLDEDNSLEAGSVAARNPTEWVKISRSPPARVKHALGTVLDLECEATGSPAPAVQWLRDDTPVTEYDEYENNAITDISDVGIARVRARLVLSDVSPSEGTVYTCTARVGDATASASTEVFNTQGIVPRPNNLSSFLALNREILAQPSAPHIVHYYVSLLQSQGRTVILPCKATGNPAPQVYWFDNDNNPILPENSRVKVLDSGELMIVGLRWDDMGGYTCVAKNSISKDSIHTFLYPMAKK